MKSAHPTFQHVFQFMTLREHSIWISVNSALHLICFLNTLWILNMKMISVSKYTKMVKWPQMELLSIII